MKATTSFPSAMSKRLLFSYVFDWCIIILIAIVGGLFTKITPNHRPFSPTDPNIAFPYVVHEKVSTSTLVLVSLFAPAVIIVAICLLFVPGPTVPKDIAKSLLWRRKLWEWNTGWMGLALALASAFLFTDGMKNLFGKPRPDLLSRCDLDVGNLQNYAVGAGPPSGILLVSWQICRQTDMSVLNDGFASFPSGHSSFSWAGLTYLTLFLCSKFAITIPYLLPRAYSAKAFPSPRRSTRDHEGSSGLQSKSNTAVLFPDPALLIHSQAAAPPVYLLVLAFIPIGAAIYISSTRYSDFKHHGFDIIFGSLMGFFLAWGSFRWYHIPIRRGAGWSWGPRSANKAWGVGLGTQSYAKDNVMENEKDIERGVTPNESDNN